MKRRWTRSARRRTNSAGTTAGTASTYVPLSTASADAAPRTANTARSPRTTLRRPRNTPVDRDALIRQARDNAARGVLRYSIVTSGKRLSDDEVARVCESICAIRENVGIAVCVSFGLLDEAQFLRLREAGVSRVHCNLETSRRYFPSVCTTHSYDEKLETLRAAQRAGLSVCSGGIMGLGEMMEDRIDMALTLRGLGVRSVPVNFLTPIPGTPYAHNAPLSDAEKRRIVAIYRFLLPDAAIRLAGGRGSSGQGRDVLPRRRKRRDLRRYADNRRYYHRNRPGAACKTRV